MAATTHAILILLLGLVATGAAAAEFFDYSAALDKTLLFLEAQRSGKLPPTQRVKWRGNSGLGDGYSQGVIIKSHTKYSPTLINFIGVYITTCDDVNLLFLF